MENEQLLDSLFGGMQGLWDKIKESAIKVGKATTKMMLELYYVLKSDETPLKDKAIIVGALAYQLLPHDLLSVKKVGALLGLTDNVVALIWAYKKMKSRITPDIERQVAETLRKWFGEGHSEIEANR
jgi:uncharacterized membrane protein YkvA (DUF1232 family)